MKIAVFADVHGNIPALKAIFEQIKKDNVDEIICLGDLVAIGPKPKECLDFVINNNITLVPGNHELYYSKGTYIDENMADEEKAHQDWVASLLGEEYKEYINSLPVEIERNINGKTFAFKHFLTKSEDSLFPFEEAIVVKTGDPVRFVKLQKADYTFIGHEHRPFTAREDNKMIVDVGSSGCTKNDITYYTLIEVEKDVKITKKEVLFDRKKLIADIQNVDYPDRDFLAKVFFGVEI